MPKGVEEIGSAARQVAEARKLSGAHVPSGGWRRSTGSRGSGSSTFGAKFGDLLSLF